MWTRDFTFLMVSLLLVSCANTTWHLETAGLMQPASCAFAVIYLLACVAVAQQVVVRASGMRYSEFLANVRKALRGEG